MLFPDARGIGETAKACAARLAGHGFAVLVADLYGNGAFAAEVSEARTLTGALRIDVDAWRRRARAALGASPYLAEMQKLFAASELAMLHAVASPYRERSHFDAQNLLGNGTAKPFGREVGWLNVALGTGDFPAAAR